MSEQAINWSASKEEMDTVDAIVQRAVPYTGTDKLTLHMDIIACHLNAYRLDLDAMEQADTFNLVHDVLGIHNNINRDTAKLENFFVPRFATLKIQE